MDGRLGLERANIRQSDRYGLIWLSRGHIFVDSGSLKFDAAGSPEMELGVYSIPHQKISIILMGPGTTVTHDALRIIARHGSLLLAVGDDGVKLYSAPPWPQAGSKRSSTARKHALLWSNETTRLDVAKKMYAFRFGEIFPHRDINVLRGIEGGRIRESYKINASRYGIVWNHRDFDRANPDTNDMPNQAINYCVGFVEAAAMISVVMAGAIPPLGFIHETSGDSFVLDIADMHRTTLTIPIAFKMAKKVMDNPSLDLEHEIRLEAGREFKRQKIIHRMIQNIESLFDVDDSGCDE